MTDSQDMRVFYVASAHWDREWYKPFQAFRYDLIGVLDDVLTVLQRDTGFTCFQTDGQSIMLEDYLEVRPEKSDAVAALAEAGRLRIGPWYVMPDEQIVSGESLIRNLEEGIRVARDLGNVSRVGFVCDIFGHVSQLPQILRGFDIATAFVFRGVDEEDHSGLFRWQSPDGSEVVTHLFGPSNGYCNIGIQVWGLLDHDDRPSVAEAAKRLRDAVQRQRERLPAGPVLLFDGADHMPIEPLTCEVLAELRKLLPNQTVEHVGLDEYARAIVEQRAAIPEQIVGELRQAGRGVSGMFLIPGVLSSRIRQKQVNRQVETLLTHWTEPFSLMAERLAGAEYPFQLLRLAWRHLLQNHAHDSICGCSPDQVHKDMEYRFDQARLIGETLTEDMLERIAQRIDLPDLEGEEQALVVFNPTQVPIDGPVTLDVRLPKDTPHTYAEFFGYEQKLAFRLIDSEGNELPYDYLGSRPHVTTYRRPHRKMPAPVTYAVARVAVPVRIPACGYSTIICRPVTRATRHAAKRMAVSQCALENESLRVEVQSNGSLSVTDKRTGECFADLLVFEDRADIGDGWFHGIAVNDDVRSSIASAADVGIVEDGAFQSTLRITHRMHVPAEFEFDKAMRRSPREVELLITSYVTLRAGADHVQVRTEVDNQVRDHRLRVLFASHVDADEYWADSAFDVVRRPIALPEDGHTYRELPVETRPQANWTAVCSQGRGLAVVAPGLPESTVRDVPQRTLALTLLRGFRRTVFTDGEEGAQSLGRHVFEYCIVPLNGLPEPVRFAGLAQRLSAGTRCVAVCSRDQAAGADRDLPTTFSQLAFRKHNLVLTSFRRAPQRGNVELRLFNPSDKPTEDSVRLSPNLPQAVLTDFEGQVQAQAATSEDGELALKVPGKRIVTVAFENPG